MTRLPHGIGQSDWLVLDWNNGLLFVAATRRDAVAWMCADGAVVKGRYCYGPGAYEYGFGLAGEDDRSRGVFIERASVATRKGGWSWAVERGVRDPDLDD